MNTHRWGIKSAFNNHHICRTDRDTSLALNHLQKPHNPHQPEQPQGYLQKNEKKRETSRHTKRRSTRVIVESKSGSKKRFVTKASDSYTSDTQVTHTITLCAKAQCI